MASISELCNTRLPAGADLVRHEVTHPTNGTAHCALIRFRATGIYRLLVGDVLLSCPQAWARRIAAM